MKIEKKYKETVKSGMFWEFHPELTGEWEKDKKTFLSSNKPKHKDLVLVETREGIVMPAIYYKTYNEFYKYSLFYHYSDTPYSKVKIKSKHKIDNVIKWQLIPNNL